MGASAVVVNDDILVDSLDSLTCSPNAGFFGQDSSTWLGHDGMDYSSSEASSYITVNPVLDGVSATSVGAAVVTEGGDVRFSLQAVLGECYKIQ